MVETAECPHCGEILEINTSEDYGPGTCSACGKGIVVLPDGQFEQAMKLIVAFTERTLPVFQALVISPREFAQLKRIEKGLGKLVSR